MAKVVGVVDAPRMIANPRRCPKCGSEAQEVFSEFTEFYRKSWAVCPQSHRWPVGSMRWETKAETALRYSMSTSVAAQKQSDDKSAFPDF